jgi:hypothetical protein
MVVKVVKFITVVGLYSLISGCLFGNYKTTIYEPSDINYHISLNKKIAFIAGDNDNTVIDITNKFTEIFAKDGLFNVVSQQEITKILPKYPLNTHIVNYKQIITMKKNKSPYLPDEDKAVVDQIGESLNADYLFVVWAPSLTRLEFQGGICIAIKVDMRVIEYPSKRIIGYSDYLHSNNDEDVSDLREDSKYKGMSLEEIIYITACENAVHTIYNEIVKNAKNENKSK